MHKHRYHYHLPIKESRYHLWQSWILVWKSWKDMVSSWLYHPKKSMSHTIMVSMEKKCLIEMEDVELIEGMGRLLGMHIGRRRIIPIGGIWLRNPCVMRIKKPDLTVMDFTVNPEYGIMKSLSGEKTNYCDRRFEE